MGHGKSLSDVLLFVGGLNGVGHGWFGKGLLDVPRLFIDYRLSLTHAAPKGAS